MNTSVFGQNHGIYPSTRLRPTSLPTMRPRLKGSRQVGVIVAVRGHQPVGIVIDRDLATRVLGTGLDAWSVRIGLAMP